MNLLVMNLLIFLIILCIINLPFIISLYNDKGLSLQYISPLLLSGLIKFFFPIFHICYHQC